VGGVHDDPPPGTPTTDCLGWRPGTGPRLAGRWVPYQGTYCVGHRICGTAATFVCLAEVEARRG
jgi:hypothetical protein